MELMQIKYFLEVAESEHMTASAEKLHIAQPALSQSIRRLENELGVTLFEKKGRNIVLSQYGRFVKERLSSAIDIVDSLPKELEVLTHKLENTVYINVLAASGLLTKAIIEYQQSHKDVKFKLLQSSEAERFDIQISTRLHAVEAQISTRLYSDDSQSSASLYSAEIRSNGKTEVILSEQICLAVPRDEKYKDLTEISLKDAEGDDFIALAGSRQFRSVCDNMCRKAGVSPNYVFESDNPAAVQDIISANMGIGFWPEHSWGKIENENVKLLSISDSDCKRDIILNLNTDTNSKQAPEFYYFLRNYFASVIKTLQ